MKKTTIKMPPKPTQAADQWVAQTGNDVSESPKSTVVELKQPAVDPKPAETIKRLTVDMPESLHRRVKVQCAQRNLKMNEIIRDFLEREFPA
ncbi:hypothetical protein [Rhizobium leguminosarum]|uniref:hypothetical protein n=1 Tax=Rhizobium leguminosarum TaxID=384 RepID=UPI00103192F8|nr:hypothetical protein [Rhizobium leguminosarum]TBG92654.1 hypothetical protein ELG73_37835 [Rhizobium leguminosarum]